ncbi:divalent-cation tolerance protein CutA [Methanolobus halotolerans]|uniref:Divalent-cation tolerance protein CutA n=2 Tax=Methanolobus halotolerans TaxID=2052935 RepID=A0A4E0QQI7_9EURY|nr:divalent-cation tolerance protein CutA [Methanolobus halotolerans]
MFIEIHTTTANVEEAKRIAHTLVEKRLAACINIYPVISVYRWEEKIEEDNEISLSIKSTSRNFEEIRKTIRSLHSYDLPAIVSRKMEGDPDYLHWVADSTD